MIGTNDDAPSPSPTTSIASGRRRRTLDTPRPSNSARWFGSSLDPENEQIDPAW
jgi:hypothetical protein